MPILMRLLELSIYAALLFLAVWAFRGLLGERLSPALRYALWLLVVARLCLPFTVESSVQLLQAVPSEPDTAQAATAFRAEPEPRQGGESDAAPLQAGDAGQPAAGNTRAGSTPSGTAQFPWAAALLALWVAGAGVRAACLLAAQAQLNRRVRAEAGEPPARVQGIHGALVRELGVRQPTLHMLPGLHTPLLKIGLRPVILLPESFGGAEEEVVSLALRHELMHVKRGDRFVCLLLRVLECVYWFHPVVWLLGRMMLRDMEIACDNAVAAGLGNQERRAYANLLVSLLGTEPPAPRFALGMAAGAHAPGDSAEAAQRIRGIFARQASTRGVRMTAGLLCGMLLFTCFTTACRPVQGTERLPAAYMQKDAAAERALRRRLGAPARYKATAQGPMYKIVADAQVVLPGVEALPIAATQRRRFTDGDIRRVADTVLGQDAIFVGAGADAFPIRELLEKELEIAQAAMQLEEAQRASLTGTVLTREDVAQIERALEHSIPFAEFQPVTPELKTYEGPGYKHTFAYALTLYNDAIYNIYGGDTDASECSYIGIMPGTGVWQNIHSNGREVPYRGTISREQALAVAAPMVEALCPDLKPVYAGAAFLKRQGALPEWGWNCVFMREVAGCGTAYGSQQPQLLAESALLPDYYEHISILVNEGGVLSFAWYTPMEITEVLEPDAPLLPFADIAEIALAELRRLPLDTIQPSKMFLQATGGYVQVDKLELGMFRVKRGAEGYQYRPVWQVYASAQNPNPEALQEYVVSPEVYESGLPVGGYYMGVHPDALPVLTLDAVDGTVVKLEEGR